jgi:hypothetical protein
MVNLVLLLLLAVYFLSGAHDKVLTKFGLSQRDNILMNMGLFIAGIVRNTFTLIESGFIGQLNIAALVSALVLCLFLNLNYKRL